MPYKQSMYEGMDDMKYYGGKDGSDGPTHSAKVHSGRFKYDIGYGADYKKGMGDSYMYEQRGNNYNAIQDGIAKSDHKKIKPQLYHNTY